MDPIEKRAQSKQPGELSQQIDAIVATFTNESACMELRVQERNSELEITNASLLAEITERKRMEVALQEKERLLSESQRIAQIGGWSWPFTGPIKWTDETYRLYGVSQETFTPTIETLVNLLLPEDRPKMQEWVRACSAGEHPAEFEFRCVRPDGSVRFLSGRGERIYDAENRPTHIFGTVQDITERMQFQEELARKNAEITNFINAVTHDLKSPLVTIKTFLGYLEKDLDAKKSESATKDLEFIHGAADKMGGRLDDLLKLARTGQTDNAPVEVTVQEIAKEAMGLVAGQIAERGVQIEVTEKPVWLTGDRERLVEIFQNLLDNAVKFLGDQPQHRLEIGAEQEGGEVVMFVRDNGKGIDLQHQANIFGLFEKLDASAPGYGMGLALVERIVQVHGGKIWVESEGLGHGATFRFTLANTQLRQP